MRIVARGNANILIDYGEPSCLYRCCVRYSGSLRQNNLYTLENFKYINETIKPLLGDLLCPMELQVIPIEFLESIRGELGEIIDDSNVIVTKLRNLRPSEFSTVLYSDHFTRLYTTEGKSKLCLEFKPKWLYNSSDYCRNCSHNVLKGRNIKYCYRRVMNDPTCLRETFRNGVDKAFIVNLLAYFENGENVLRKLYHLQKQAHTQVLGEIRNNDDVTDDLLLEMTLKDVTCFLQWHVDGDISCQIVDVDLKPKEKWVHWLKTETQLRDLNSKIYAN